MSVSSLSILTCSYVVHRYCLGDMYRYYAVHVPKSGIYVPIAYCPYGVASLGSSHLRALCSGLASYTDKPQLLA